MVMVKGHLDVTLTTYYHDLRLVISKLSLSAFVKVMVKFFKRRHSNKGHAANKVFLEFKSQQQMHYRVCKSNQSSVFQTCLPS